MLFAFLIGYLTTHFIKKQGSSLRYHVVRCFANWYNDAKTRSSWITIFTSFNRGYKATKYTKIFIQRLIKSEHICFAFMRALIQVLMTIILNLWIWMYSDTLCYQFKCYEASMYDVRSGLGEGAPQKADERNKISWFVTEGEAHHDA